jgi:hypothetical protein
MDDPRLSSQVRAWLDRGLTVPEMERRLSEGGVAPEDASSIVDEVLAHQVSDSLAAERRQARGPFWGGVALCLLGTLLMVAGVLAFVRPEMGIPAHVAVFAVGGATVGAGIRLILQATM